jgi:hypothetical protein
MNYLFSTTFTCPSHKTTASPFVQLGDNSTIPSVGKGNCMIQSNRNSILLKDVLAVPGLAKNLFSPGQAAESGLKFLIDFEFMTIFRNCGFVPPRGAVFAKIRKSPDNLYRMNTNLEQYHDDIRTTSALSGMQD